MHVTDKFIIKTQLSIYLKDDNVLPDFSSTLQITPSREEISDYKVLAKQFKENFNAFNARIKSDALKRKLKSCKLDHIIEKQFHVKINTLKNVLDYTGTIDYRIPRNLMIKHTVLCLVFPNKNIFLKESVRNDYEIKYGYYSKKLGLPSISLCLIPISDKSQYTLSEDIKNAVLLKDAANLSINLGCLAKHSALADFLKKGGRDFSNYLIDKSSIYAIDNEFLFNKKDIRKNEMLKKYNELYVLENEYIRKSNLLDNLLIFNTNYKDACKILNFSSKCLRDNLKDFINISPLFSQYNKKDRENMLKILNKPNFNKNEERWLSIINSSSALLRKTIRQSSEITSQIFNFTPKTFPSINFDHKTFILKKALVKEVVRHKKILEIGPGCNATLSLYLKKKFPKIDITAIELNKDFVRNAKKTALLNNLKVKIKSGDIVNGVKDKFDIIFWNIPYVTSNVKHMDSVAKGLFNNLNKYATETDDGSAIIARFLNEAKVNLKSKGRLIFASNTYYVSDAKIKDIIKNSDLKLLRVYTQKNNSAKSYVME